MLYFFKKIIYICTILLISFTTYCLISKDFLYEKYTETKLINGKISIIEWVGINNDKLCTIRTFRSNSRDRIELVNQINSGTVYMSNDSMFSLMIGMSIGFILLSVFISTTLDYSSRDYYYANLYRFKLVQKLLIFFGFKVNNTCIQISNTRIDDWSNYFQHEKIS